MMGMAARMVRTYPRRSTCRVRSHTARSISRRSLSRPIVPGDRSAATLCRRSTRRRPGRSPRTAPLPKPRRRCRRRSGPRSPHRNVSTQRLVRPRRRRCPPPRRSPPRRPGDGSSPPRCRSLHRRRQPPCPSIDPRPTPPPSHIALVESHPHRFWRLDEVADHRCTEYEATSVPLWVKILPSPWAIPSRTRWPDCRRGTTGRVVRHRERRC